MSTENKNVIFRALHQSIAPRVGARIETETYGRLTCADCIAPHAGARITQKSHRKAFLWLLFC